MKELRKKILLSTLLVFVNGCHKSTLPLNNIQENIGQKDKANEFNFSLKDLSQSYVQRKLRTYLNANIRK